MPLGCGGNPVDFGCFQSFLDGSALCRCVQPGEIEIGQLSGVMRRRIRADQLGSRESVTGADLGARFIIAEPADEIVRDPIGARSAERRRKNHAFEFAKLHQNVLLKNPRRSITNSPGRTRRSMRPRLVLLRSLQTAVRNESDRSLECHRSGRRALLATGLFR